MLPIVSGGRKPIVIEADWTIGLDLTSIFVLDHLDLLERTLRSFFKVKVTAEAMESLYVERLTVRFHQPARIKAAKEIQRLVNDRRIRIVEATSASTELVDEVSAGSGGASRNMPARQRCDYLREAHLPGSVIDGSSGGHVGIR